MAGGVDFPRADVLAQGKTRRPVHGAHEGPSAGDHRRDLISGKRRDRLGGARCRPRAFELCAGDETAFFQEHDESREPFLVIAHVQILGRRDALARMATGIDVPFPTSSGGDIERVSVGFPALVEHRLVGFGRYRPHPVHPAQIVHAVHAGSPAKDTLPVPIMASRVTNSASCSSVRCSVAAGRSGRTRYRISEVESQTRISTSSPISSPNSRNTPRGSITARERYGADLYQTGGSPRTGHG